ncbi:MAG TPA: pyridoxamine 5'-phosphate oxidase family protein [Acidimicrobiales bacterium]|nr:pyridoxamine 5'-phosphate oxidase family protein [Acidimicrobiales bacterium]
MLETQEDLDWLQSLLDRSHARSGEHLRSIITEGDRTPSAAQVAKYLEGMKVLVVTTVSASGRPRSSAVDGHLLRGKFVFTTSGDAVKARDIESRPSVSAAHVDGERFALFVHGDAEVIGPDHEDRAWIDEHLTSHYGSSPTTWGPSIVFARIKPSFAIAYAPDARELPG